MNESIKKNRTLVWGEEINFVYSCDLDNTY